MHLNPGYPIVFLSALFFVVAGYAILGSAFLPLTGFIFLDSLALDTHYKYFSLLIIPLGTYFVIANWVGWQYYRNT